MTTKSELLKARGKYFQQSNDLSVLQFDNNISSKKSFDIKKQQKEAYNKYRFMQELNKAYDKNKEEQKQEEHDFEDCFFCSQCRELFSMEEMGTSELAMQDRICKYCMNNGYGR